MTLTRPTTHLPPIVYHYFKSPLPYVQTLALQERLHQIQYARREEGKNHKDVLLLLQHRPVYTSGRRQTEQELSTDRTRLMSLEADFVTTQRGGQLTYHGPGQLVGYPLLDLSRPEPVIRTRDYVDRVQRALDLYIRQTHEIATSPSDNTGVFVGKHKKLASIGIQIRHYLTNHGFAMNVTNEPLTWFDQIVACGLADVKACSIQSETGKQISVEQTLPGVLEEFSKILDRNFVPMDPNAEEEMGEEILKLEEIARLAGPLPERPPSAPLS